MLNSITQGHVRKQQHRRDERKSHFKLNRAFKVIRGHSYWCRQMIKESRANAKVSARQPWYIGRNSLNLLSLRIAQQYQRNLYIIEKYFQCATIPSLTVRVYLHSFSRSCLPNMPTSAKFTEIELRAVQGHPRSMILVPIESALYEFLSVIIVTLVLSCTVSEIRRRIG